MQVKVGEEADELNEKIEDEAYAARRVLTSVTRREFSLRETSLSQPSFSWREQQGQDLKPSAAPRIKILRTS